MLPSTWSHEPCRNIDTTTARNTFLSGNASAEPGSPGITQLPVALPGQIVRDRLGVDHLAGDGGVPGQELDLLAGLLGLDRGEDVDAGGDDGDREDGLRP